MIGEVWAHFGRVGQDFALGTVVGRRGSTTFEMRIGSLGCGRVVMVCGIFEVMTHLGRL